MKTIDFLTSLKRIALFFVLVGIIGVTEVVFAQGEGPIPQFTSFQMDFTGDGQPDLVFREPTSGKWIIQSIDRTLFSTTLGSFDDRAVPADYDGDQIEDLAVVVSNTRGLLLWKIRRSSDGVELDVRWGIEQDVIVQGDYDGDGKADIAVWRPSDATWHILGSSSGEMNVQKFGLSSDKAMPGDYNGDGITDLGVYRGEESALYYIATPEDRIIKQVFGPFVMSGNESFIPADYDGDGKTDFASFDATNGGLWMIFQSSTGTYQSVGLIGSSAVCGPFAPDPCVVTDFPVPADYDLDGKVDPAIWDSINAKVIAFGSRTGEMSIPTETTLDMISVSSFYLTK
jgi:hypothetical protein